jgi:RNA polymerase sigma-70 factor, ECF subfamily
VIGSDFAQTLAAAQQGSEQAVSVLWRDIHPRLLRYLRTLNAGAAEDVESETWLQAARDLGRFEGNEMEFLAWMFTIARHRLSDWNRMAARRPSIPVPAEGLQDHPGHDDPAAATIDGLDTEAALALVSALPRDQAEVILLRVLAGLDTERVAQILGKRPGTIRVLQHRGLRRLAESMAERPSSCGK